MTVEQELPTTSTITEVPNADGTVTRTVVNEYKDGSKRTVKEILPEAEKAPPMVQALPANPTPLTPFYANNDIEGQQQHHSSTAVPQPPPPTAPLMMVVADEQQPTSPPSRRSKKAPSVPRNPLTGLSIVFVVLGTTFGIAAGVYAYLSQTVEDDKNADIYEEVGLKGQYAGAAAIFLFTLATPFMFFSGKLYRSKRSSKGLPAFVMTSWIIYGFALAYAGGLLFLAMEGVIEDYVQPMWVFVAVAFNLVPFLFMMVHAEAARTR